MQLVDCHSHIQFPAYDADREAVLARAREAGVKMLAVGTHEESSWAAIELAKKNPGEVWATVGFHPNHLAEEGEWHHDIHEQTEASRPVFDAAIFRELAKAPEVVAIGECGLDYYRPKAGSKNQEVRIKERQKAVFLEHILIAKEVQKPLMLHCRPSKGTDDAYEDFLSMSLVVSRQSSVILHFYVGSVSITKELLEQPNFYFEFGGVVTFSKDYNEQIKIIPLERILLETDAPYVAPEPFRGKRNEPSFLQKTAARIAEIKGVSLDEVARVTTHNAETIFGISIK